MREIPTQENVYAEFHSAAGKASGDAQPAIEKTKDQRMKRELKLLDATSIVAGSMIGSGIFIVSAVMARHVGSPGWLLVAWGIAGVMTLIAAVSYGELSAMYPRAGGQYTYLKEAYGPFVAFLYGWALFAVIQTGIIAAVAVSFSKFTAYFFPSLSEDVTLLQIGSYRISAAQGFGIALITALTYANSRGVKNGKIIQTTFTVVKMVSLVGLIIAGFVLMKPEVWQANWAEAWDMRRSDSGTMIGVIGPAAAIGAVAAAMVGSIFANDAWNNVTFIAGEIVNPKKNVGLSLLLGTGAVTVIYLAANLMFIAVLPINEIAHADKDLVGTAVAAAIFGAGGTALIALMIMVSTFGCNNGMILSGARVYHTMAKDGLFFRQAGKLNSRQVPASGLWMQCVMASILCLSGRYGDLLDMVSFVVVIFYMLTIAGIFILRIRKPEIERPYRAFGYPVLPLLYLLMGTAFCCFLAFYRPQFTWPGLAIVLLGVPLYYISIRDQKKKENPAKPVVVLE